MASEQTGVLSFSSSFDTRIHPLSSSPSSCFPTSTPPPTASTQSNGTNPSFDDVTTIFVVGFPDDMTEREFQNMFTFSPGFEAASLKWHSKDHEDESAPSTASKKQMIGFARFRTRLEAMEAVEVLNGKRVDLERGTLLKAEMAKKNLHIKRGSVVPTAAAQGVAAAAAAAVAATNTVAPTPIAAVDSMSSPLSILSKKMSFQPSSYEAFSPLPSDLLSPVDYYKTDPFAKDPFQNCSVPATPVFNDAIFGLRSQSFDARSIDLMSPPRSFGLIPPPRMNKAVQETSNIDPFNYLSKSSPVPTERAFNTSSPPPTSTSSILVNGNNNASMGGSGSIAEAAPITRRLGSLSIQTNNFPSEFRSPSMSSPSYNSRSFNPADQNPPCNTLYVGNLPPNTSEEELRSLFIKCQAFKRMSFRNKAQGPMCFVEFEDVHFANQAMNELQGYCLSNSVKGGIRLSFSKNPLFIKPNKATKEAESIN